MDNRRVEQNHQTNPERVGKPKINIMLSLGPHGTTKDFGNLTQELEAADIFVPEVVGWDERTLMLYNGVSNGDATAEEALAEELKRRNISRPISDFPSWLERLRAIYKTKKPVIIIEPPTGHSLLKMQEEAENFSKSINMKLPFDEFVEWEGQQTKKDAEFQKAREAYMVSQLRIGVDKVLADHPELAQKNQINILIRIGDLHTTLANLFRGQGFDVERRYTRQPEIFSYRNQAELRYKLGKEVTRGFLAKVVFETLISVAFRDEVSNVTQDSWLREAVVHKLTTLLDPKDTKQIESIYTLFQNSGTKGMRESLNERLNQKGITVPKTEREMEDFVSTRFSLDNH